MEYKALAALCINTNSISGKLILNKNSPPREQKKKDAARISMPLNLTHQPPCTCSLQPTRLLCTNSLQPSPPDLQLMLEYQTTHMMIAQPANPCSLVTAAQLEKVS